LVVEGLFAVLHLVPDQRNATIMEATVSWNYSTVLNILFLGLSVVLVVRFLRTGGPDMLRMMSERPDEHSEHDHGSTDEHDHGSGEEYTCPMHPEVVNQGPGRCPKCGMDLVPRE